MFREPCTVGLVLTSHHIETVPQTILFFISERLLQYYLHLPLLSFLITLIYYLLLSWLFSLTVDPRQPYVQQIAFVLQARNTPRCSIMRGVFVLVYKMRKEHTSSESTRRRVIQGIGATGVAVGLGTGIGAAAQPRNPGKNKGMHGGAAPDNPGNQGYECPDGTVSLGTFEFVVEADEEGTIEDCYFEQTDGGDELVTITDFENKTDDDGEEHACEPISVTYEVDGYVVESVASFGGNDTHVDADPADGTYDADLVNPGGEQAAISTLYICGTESTAP